MKFDFELPIYKIGDLKSKQLSSGKVFEKRTVYLDDSFKDEENFIPVEFSGKHLNDPLYFKVGDKVKVKVFMNGRGYVNKDGEWDVIVHIRGVEISNAETGQKPQEHIENLPF